MASVVQDYGSFIIGNLVIGSLIIANLIIANLIIESLARLKIPSCWWQVAAQAGQAGLPV